MAVDPELRARWFMAGPGDIRPGGTIGFAVAHDALSDDAVEAPEAYREYSGRSWAETVLRVEPEHLLAFEWDNGANGSVTITLEPVGERTQLVLHHTDIKDRAGALNFAGGWGSHLAALERRIRGEGVPNFWALHAAAEATAKASLTG